MKLQTLAGLIGGVVIAASITPALAQEVFLTCPHDRYCAALSVNGEFYSGDPHVTTPGDPFTHRRNVVDGRYPAAEQPGVRISNFWCTSDEWCLALDNKGGIYAGTARPSSNGGDNFMKR